MSQFQVRNLYERKLDNSSFEQKRNQFRTQSKGKSGPPVPGVDLTILLQKYLSNLIENDKLEIFQSTFGYGLFDSESSIS